MPVREREKTIGIFGTGEVPDALNEQLLADQATGEVKFIVGFSDTPEIRAAIDFARKHSIPYELVVEPGLEVPKGAVRITEAANVPSKVVQMLELAKRPKLLVYWSEEDNNAKIAIRRGIEAEIEVRDLCDALTRLGKLTDPEEKQVAKKTYSRAELEAMEDEEIRPVAEELGIDPEAFDDWDQVIDEMLKAQKKGPSAADNGTGKSEDNSEDDEPYYYSKEELEELDLSDLKELCRTNDISVPAGSRKPTYVKVLLEYQAEDAAGGSEPAASAPDASAPVAADLATVTQHVIDAIDKRLTQMVGEIDQSLAQTAEKMVELLIERLPKGASGGREPEQADKPRPKLRPIKR